MYFDLLSLKPYWVGPGGLSGGARPWWVGPGSGTGAASMSSMELSVALTKLGDELRNTKSRKPEDSPSTVGGWNDAPPRLAVTSAAVPSQDSLQRYDAATLQSILVQQVAGELRLELASAAATVKAATSGSPVTQIAKPTVKMFDEELKAVTKAAGRRGLQLEEAFTQALSPAAYFAAITGLAEQSKGATLLYLTVATDVLGNLLHGMKHAFGIARPSQKEGLLLPIVALPSHGSFPAGHAAYSYMLAELIAALNPLADRDSLLKVAGFAADNRVVAGVHYPIDSIAGEVLGRGLAAWLVALGSPNPSAATWRPTRYAVDTAKDKGTRHLDNAASDAGMAAPWQWLTHMAAKEWA
jgi:hypothetical protein